MDNITAMVTVTYYNNLPECIYIKYIKYIDWHKINSITRHIGDIKNLLWMQLTDTLKFLDISNTTLTSLNGIQNCTALQKLYCHNNKLTSLDGLQNCIYLQILKCYRNKLSSLDGLQNCTALQELDISSNKISSLDGVQNCKALQKLNISHNNITSINAPNGLQNCISLQILECYCNKLSSLNGLQNCVALQELSISYNKLVSLDGLQNCTALQKLGISDNIGITTIPTFLSNFRKLREFIDIDIELEEDARYHRFINRLWYGSPYNINYILVYNYDRNVYNKKIETTAQASMSRLLNQPLIPEYNIDNLNKYIRSDNILTSKSKSQLLSYISIYSLFRNTIYSHEEQVKLSITYSELLWAVWQTIHSLGEFDEPTQQQIKQILNQELEDNDCGSYTALMTSLVNILNGFSPLVEIKIFDGVQIGNIVAIIKQRLERSQYGYTVEKHKEEFRKEMLDRGESVEVMNEWLEFIE